MEPKRIVDWADCGESILSGLSLLYKHEESARSTETGELGWHKPRASHHQNSRMRRQPVTSRRPGRTGAESARRMGNHPSQPEAVLRLRGEIASSPSLSYCFSSPTYLLLSSFPSTSGPIASSIFLFSTLLPLPPHPHPFSSRPQFPVHSQWVALVSCPWLSFLSRP